MSSFSAASLAGMPSVHSLIASRSRHSPLDENPAPHPFDSPSTMQSSWQSDQSDSPSLYSGMSPSSQAPTPSVAEGGAQDDRLTAGSTLGSYDDDELGFTGRRRESGGTLTPSFQDNTPYSPYQAFLSLQHNHTLSPLSPSERSPTSQSFDDNLTLSGTESSPRSSIDVNNRDALGPKLRFGEAAPWELDSPSTSSHIEEGSDGSSRRPSLPTGLEADQPHSLSTSSSNMSFSRAGAAAGLGVAANGFRTRSRSATQTAAGVLKGLGGLMGRKKSKEGDADEVWAASGLGIESTKQGSLRRKVSSETVMLGADLFGGGGGERGRHEGGGELSGKRSFTSLRIGRSSPTSSRAPSLYSTHSNQDIVQYSTSTSSSPNRPIPPLPNPTNNNPRTPPSPFLNDSPSLVFINNTQHHGLISLGEAQERQKDTLDRMATPSKQGGVEQLPSPLPSPAVASTARGPLRALASSSSTIKQSDSEASVSSADSVVLIEVDADQHRRTPVSLKLSSTEGIASAPPLPTPPKSSLKNKKSVGGVGGLMKIFSNNRPPSRSSTSPPTSFVPPPLPSLPSSSASSTAQPSISSTSGLSLQSYSRRPSANGNLPPTPTDSIFKHTEGFSSSVTNAFRSKPPPPNLSLLPISKSSSSNSSDEISPFPNLKLRPQSMAFTAGLPQSYLSSVPPPIPSLAPASPYFEAGSLLQLHSKPPPSPSASSFTTAHSYASEASNQFSSSASGGSTVESASLLSPTRAGGFAMSGFVNGSGSGSGSGSGREEGGGYSEEEKDLVIKRLEEMVINERKIWRIKEAEYESQIRELTFALNPPVTKTIPSRSSNSPSATSNGMIHPSVCPTTSTSTSSSSSSSSSSSHPHPSCSSCGSHLNTAPSASTAALHVPGDHLAATSILNRGKPKTGGARGVFGSGSLRE